MNSVHLTVSRNIFIIIIRISLILIIHKCIHSCKILIHVALI